MHLPEVYTDGSFAREAPVIGFAGYGVWFGPFDPRNRALYVEGEVQTVNRAELSACIIALQLVLGGQPVRVVTDSKYVYDGVLCHLQCWRLRGQNYLNSDLWDQLWAAVQARIAPTQWKHVYSHIGVAGNERADELANQGCLLHPGRRRSLRNKAAQGEDGVVRVRTTQRPARQ